MGILEASASDNQYVAEMLRVVDIAYCVSLLKTSENTFRVKNLRDDTEETFSEESEAVTYAEKLGQSLQCNAYYLNKRKCLYSPTAENKI